MYNNLRLTELHEEWAWQESRAKMLGNGHPSQQRLADNLDAEIRARVARQETGRWEAENPGSRFGVPDAVRTYRVPREAAP